MSKKEDYIKYINLAKKLINKYGTDLTVTMGINCYDEDKPYKPATTKEVEYTTVGVVMPPVRGIYFQGTRFGEHSEFWNGVLDDKMSCFLLPVYDENGNAIDLSQATHVTNDGVKYKVFFCDEMKPAKRVIMFSYGLGR